MSNSLGSFIDKYGVNIASSLNSYNDMKNLLNNIYGSQGSYSLLYIYSLELYEREVSKIIDRIIMNGESYSDTEEELKEYVSDTIAYTIYIKYYQKWQHQYDALVLEYDITKPYDISIDETEKNILKTSSDIDQTNSGSYTDTDSLTSHNIENEGSIYSFTATDTPVHTDKNTESETRQGSTTGSNSGTRNTDTKYDSTRDVNKETIKKGNTGNITNQELVEKEINLRNTMIYKIIFKDLNELMTRSVYNY